MINIMNINAITPYRVYQSIYCTVRSNEVAIPINTVQPPKTGIGSRCSFLALGLSTILCFFANLITKGYAMEDTASATMRLNIIIVRFIIEIVLLPKIVK